MLRFYDREGYEIDLEQQLTTYCDNPTCLGEPWCSAWGLCNNKNMESSPISGTLLSEVPEIEYDEVFMSLCQQEENDRSSSHLTELRTTLPIDVPAVSASKLPSISLTPSDCNGSLSATSTKKRNRVFSTLKTDHEVEVARATSVSARTHKDTKYCLGLWES